ncbi:cyclic AMP-dependent transcription factor ATF-3-like [Acropora muricata]|uniref:cyclic AMP-dependent transcription factor ATF-3-like n=1 Tax=Acropora millepora TaxID=45264 RepID=UPI0010FC7E69|nr:cyclic AMP-dependent transcription factor ATF-3-like [Acropora millepora]
MDFPGNSQVGNGLYLESGSVIRAVGNPASDVAIAVDPNFEIADLPVKLELRYVIESKRAANGLECPKTDYRLRDAKNQQLTPDEEQRRKLRRERNKVAASKCRMKRKEHVTTLRKASEELEAANSQLESEIAYLTAEREQLEMMLDAHVCHMEKAAGRGPA